MICSKFITFAVTKTTTPCNIRTLGCCDLLKIHYLCGDKDNSCSDWKATSSVVICSKFITFAVTKTTKVRNKIFNTELWFAQNSLPLRWQRQHNQPAEPPVISCDLLKIHYLCGDKDNTFNRVTMFEVVVICSKFITFAVTKTTKWIIIIADNSCDLLKIHYLCGDKDNAATILAKQR